nr:947_t:CDS:2 [Entrophospora candida]
MSELYLKLENLVRGKEIAAGKWLILAQPVFQSSEILLGSRYPSSIGCTFAGIFGKI